MKLTNKYENQEYKEMKEYFCDLTDELNRLAGLTINKEYWRGHYILVDDYCLKHNCLAIRIPGGTVGEIKVDKDNVITEINVDTDYVVKTYVKDVNEQIQKFVGEKIEILA